MRFTRFALLSSSLLLAGFIVVRAASPVNHNQPNSEPNKLQLVDGAPLPPPHAAVDNALFADGAPLPPPRLDGGSVLFADGAPLPPPRAVDGLVLLADGAPLPPPHLAMQLWANV